MLNKLIADYIRDNLRYKTITIEDRRYGTTMPLYIQAAGPKRIHIKILASKESLYMSIGNFTLMLMDGYTILSEPEIAKYYLSKKERSLLDV